MDTHISRRLGQDRSDHSNHIIGGAFNASMLLFVLRSLTGTIGALIDGIIIGQFLGSDSLAAFGLVSPIILIFTLIGQIVAAGSRNLFTLRVGNGDLEGANGVFSLSEVIGVGLSLLLMLIVFVFPNQICTLLGVSGNAAPLLGKARGYLIGIAIGLPAMNAQRILSNYMIIDNDRYLPVIASLVLTTVDITLDVLIAVMGGSTFGMGLATSVSYYAALIILLTHFTKRDRILQFSFSFIRWKDAARMFAKGLPVGAGRLANTLRSVVLNHLLAISATAGCIAAYSVHRQADSFLNPLVFGIGDTVVTLVCILVGEENRPMLQKLTQKYLIMVFTVVLGASILFWFASPYFAAFFIKDDTDALAYGVRAARSYAAGLTLYALNRAYLSYLEGSGKTKTTMVFNLFSEGAFLVLFAMLLFPRYHADAVWYAFPASQVLLLLTILADIVIVNIKEKAHPANFWDWMLALPNDFDVPEEDRIDRSITSHEEVIALSKAAWTFCDEHGCDGKRKYAISLAVEELATNTVLTGFHPKRHNSIDMRILKKGEDYILRMRDDCEIFDPIKQLQLYDRSVPTHHIGLRMAIASARDVQYTSILKLNNLVLRV